MKRKLANDFSCLADNQNSFMGYRMLCTSAIIIQSLKKG